MDLLERNDNLNRHPWELSRTDSILSIANHFCCFPSERLRIVDVGAGDRYFEHRVLMENKSNKKIVFHAVDNHYVNEIETDPNIKLYTNISQIEDNFADIVFMMDVLEHVPDDLNFLLDVAKKIQPGKYLLITVPAFQGLFSSHDRYLGHYRRYTMESLEKLIKKSPLHIVWQQYFYTSLFFVRLLQVVKEKILGNTRTRNETGSWQLPEKHYITTKLRWILNLDFKLCNKCNLLGIPLPGLSALIICQK